jgi:transposase
MSGAYPLGDAVLSHAVRHTSAKFHCALSQLPSRYPGKVYGLTASRKRQSEFIAFLEQLNREIPASVTTIHVVLDNLRMHKGKQVQAWLAQHPRFIFHHPPVHCSWMNQVEQWFGILKRKRLRIADFPSKERLAERLMAFISEWNEIAHPFNWTSKSVAKVMAKCQIEDAKPLTEAA